MNTDQKIALLKDEYLLLQRFYEDFDARLLTVKGWSVTVATAAIGVGFYQSRYLWLFAAGASLLFWVLEAVWKTFQYAYAPRIQKIEHAFRTSEFDSIEPLQVYSSWVHGWQPSEIPRNMLLLIVFVPHAITFVAGITLFVLEAVLGVPLSRTA